jgi:hypothetical protein
MSTLAAPAKVDPGPDAGFGTRYSRTTIVLPGGCASLLTSGAQPEKDRITAATKE